MPYASMCPHLRRQSRSQMTLYQPRTSPADRGGRSCSLASSRRRIIFALTKPPISPYHPDSRFGAPAFNFNPITRRFAPGVTLHNYPSFPVTASARHHSVCRAAFGGGGFKTCLVSTAASFGIKAGLGNFDTLGQFPRLQPATEATRSCRTPPVPGGEQEQCKQLGSTSPPRPQVTVSLRRLGGGDGDHYRTFIYQKVSLRGRSRRCYPSSTEVRSPRLIFNESVPPSFRSSACASRTRPVHPLSGADHGSKKAAVRRTPACSTCNRK